MDNCCSFNSIFSGIISEESSTSFEDDSPFIWFKLLRKINDFYLDALHATFKEKCYIFDPKKVNLENGLNKEEFIKAIDEVFGESKYTAESIAIFNEIDNNEKGEITWEEFLDFSEKQLRHTVEAKLVLGEPKVICCPHLKRETINKILPLETKNYFCYALISKHGCVGLYDGNMNFLLSYTIIMNREDVDKSDDERRRKKNRWITDAVFAPNRQMFIITNSTRSITIYDASNLHHIPLWLIIGCPSILTSLCFLDKKVKPILYSGNEYGEIITFEFHQKDDLFRKKHSDKMSLFYWGELKNEKESVSIKNLGKIHQGAINHLKYFENTECLLTCSKDSKKSVMIKTKIKEYIFNVKKGVNCCYLSNKLKQLITGSEDGKIHVFNIFVTKNPIQIIKLHKTGIIDLIILECNNYSISCSRDGYLILMDLKEFVPLQTLCIQFQAFNELGKIIEWGKNSLCPGPKRQQTKEKELNLNENYDVWERTNILITCCNNLVSLDLHFLDGKIRNFDSSVLPPPPLQNSVLIPVHWKISEEKREIKCEVSEWDENLSEHIKSLEFILNKDLIKPEDRNNINFKISQLEAKKNQMRRAVAEGAPYLALDLPNISELQLSPNLPIPDQKKIQRIVQKSYRLLSAASQRSIIFSSSSPSSSSRSKSRSSIIEFD